MKRTFTSYFPGPPGARFTTHDCGPLEDLENVKVLCSETLLSGSLYFITTTANWIALSKSTRSVTISTFRLSRPINTVPGATSACPKSALEPSVRLMRAVQRAFSGPPSSTGTLVTHDAVRLASWKDCVTLYWWSGSWYVKSPLMSRTPSNDP